MTSSTSAVAVCCCSNSVRSRAQLQLVEQPRFSMAMTAWSAKFFTSSICLSVNGRTLLAVDENNAEQLASFPSRGTQSIGTIA